MEDHPGGQERSLKREKGKEGEVEVDVKQGNPKSNSLLPICFFSCLFSILSLARGCGKTSLSSIEDGMGGQEDHVCFYFYVFFFEDLPILEKLEKKITSCEEKLKGGSW